MPESPSVPTANPAAEPLTLYSNPMSRGRIVRWMLEEIGQPYTCVMLDFGPAMKTPDYMAINPMGKVPALTHGARVVTEYSAICAYLAEAFPDAGLVAEDRASYYRWMFFGAGPLEAAVTNTALGFEPPAEREGMVGYGTLARTLDTLEHAVTVTPFIAGPRFSAADVTIGSQIGFGLRFGSIKARPAFAAYWARISDRPAAVRANALDDALLPKQS